MSPQKDVAHTKAGRVHADEAAKGVRRTARPQKKLRTQTGYTESRTAVAGGGDSHHDVKGEDVSCGPHADRGDEEESTISHR